jgi:hypothetical protein
MRSFGDLDILIHANNISQLYQILCDQGYILTDLSLMDAGRILRVLQRKNLQFMFHDDILEAIGKSSNACLLFLLIWNRYGIDPSLFS